MPTCRQRRRSSRLPKVAIFGVSYKPGGGDIRESPALTIIELLVELGADVTYYDPHVPALAEMGLESVSVEEALQGAELAVIVTAHPGVDHIARPPEIAPVDR